MIMRKRNIKYRYIGIAAITALTIILYMIELLNSKPLFDITSFSLNYVVSLPFILLSMILNWGIAVIINTSIFQKQRFFARIILSSILVISTAILLVIIGNLPFRSDIDVFVKTEPFWRSVGATTLLNITLLLIIDYILQAMINRNLQKENAILQYRQLKSQINPHFLFNSLNVLISTINKDQEAAVKYTKKLSAVYRYVLTQDLQDTVTVMEEMHFINNYIDILRSRFNKGLEVKININSEDMLRSIPPMSLQLLVENAVKHNSLLPDDPLVINISTNHSSLIVSNNLKPRMSHPGESGIGLKNLSKKYKLIAGTDISVLKENNTFTVKLPLL